MTAGAAALMLGTSMFAVLQPATPAEAGTSMREAAPQGEQEHESLDLDNRRGVVAPNSRQRSAAPGVRFNALGTPSAEGPGVLASGLSSDPVAAARAYLADPANGYGLEAAAVGAMDVVLQRAIGAGTVVTLRQRFGDLPAGFDGLASLLVKDGAVLRVTSSLSRDTSAPDPATVTKEQAVATVLADVRLPAGTETSVQSVAVPTPADGPRAAFAVTAIAAGGTPVAVTTYVDARTGAVLVREDLVDYDSDNPTWAVFPSTPNQRNQRQLWCFEAKPGCARTVATADTGAPWDVDPVTGLPTFTTRGNSADNVVMWGGDAAPFPATPTTDRTYVYPFTDQWKASRCDPAVYASAQRNDADAAVTNLFAMHNRMHDWSYHLGFTESAWNMQVVNTTGQGLGGDPENGRAQQNALGGSRNNANQGTPRDGLPPTTNMYLWQPIAGAAYPPCVDGDYDMTVIGHEYSHAITNRMIAGPDTGIGSLQGGSMGESWSDLLAMEYLFENGLRAAGDTPFVTGAYVTGNTVNGIRNYDSSRSPLNFSDMAYDQVGQQAHADGEIWTATQLRLRTAFLEEYGDGSAELQKRCAEGKVDIGRCPGNRRWIQLMFDSFLLQAASQFSMLDMRDNMLAADLARFGGENQKLLWDVFAESGMGRDATSGPSDAQPVPSFASPQARNATVTVKAAAPVQVFVGDYEARVTPVADTDPATPLGDTFEIVPGVNFEFVVTGAGYGHQRLSRSFRAGRSSTLEVRLPENLASAARGATASGPGVNLDKLIDDTEGTNWASTDGVAGRTVTVDLAGTGRRVITSVNVSALLRPAILTDADPANPQNRFTALRSFAVWACDATRADCTTDAGYRRVYVSPSDAFPAPNFRPTAPTVNLRSFRIPPTSATHVRLEVLSSQCTGNPRYAGEQDNDPAAGTDCATNSPFRDQVRISEFQVYGR
ncbi:M36 family metallopeptidase [Catenuloplanes sp. NPDC051500]|uniref:M36 family metallopeptidase n=1 Tax=Catenuloplanes sp. NPDC051500 TaxID=3363959 RepID=UPI0037BD7F8A